jgi:hypothetical protein
MSTLNEYLFQEKSGRIRTEREGTAGWPHTFTKVLCEG